MCVRVLYLFPALMNATLMLGSKKRSYFAELEKTLKPPDGSMRLKEFKLAVNKLLGTTEFDDQLEKVRDYQLGCRFLVVVVAWGINRVFVAHSLASEKG